MSGRGVSDEDAVELPLKEGLEPLSGSVSGRSQEMSIGWGEFN